MELPKYPEDVIDVTSDPEGEQYFAEDRAKVHCVHGTYVGYPGGADYLCQYCENGEYTLVANKVADLYLTPPGGVEVKHRRYFIENEEDSQLLGMDYQLIIDRGISARIEYPEDYYWSEPSIDANGADMAFTWDETTGGIVFYMRDGLVGIELYGTAADRAKLPEALAMLIRQAEKQMSLLHAREDE